MNYLNLVVLRDNVGEAFWYVLIQQSLISSIVYYNVQQHQGCAVDMLLSKAESR